MRRPNDDMLDGALRAAAARLRNQEIAHADPDEAWARFVTEHADDAVVPVRFAGSGPRRAWLSVAAIGLAAATVLVVVWLQSRPAPQQPVDSPRPTVAVPSTTQAPAVDAAPPILLPTFPEDKAIASMSAVSDSEWYALSDLGPPERQWYPKLWHTVDAGATWVDTHLPDAAAGGPWVHFADPLNGWLLCDTCNLVATHDGGETWKQIDGVVLRGGQFAAPPAISTFGGRVYVLADVPNIDGNSRIGVMSSPVDSDDFVWSGTIIGDVRWALTPGSGQLAVNGESGWAIAYGATAPGATVSDGVDVPPGAARLIDGEWTEWAPPCAISLEGERPYEMIKVPQLILGVSTSGGTVALVCGGAPTYGAPRAFVSADNGETFAETTRLPDGMTLTPQSWVLVPDDDTILIGIALDTGELAVASSDDRGTSWTVETSFDGGGRFDAATITPTGRIVVVATIEDSPSARRDEAQVRDDSGTWHPIRSA